MHDKLVHQGIRRCEAILRRRFYWPNYILGFNKNNKNNFFYQNNNNMLKYFVVQVIGKFCKYF